MSENEAIRRGDVERIMGELHDFYANVPASQSVIFHARARLRALPASLAFPPDDPTLRIKAAIDLAVSFGGIDGAHHKSWVIDQMVRALAGPEYEAIVRDSKAGEDGPETYSWDEGVAP
jgi:hypothetical protein